MAELGVAPWLLDLLRCPLPHHAKLDAQAQISSLVCTECGNIYPVRDGLPIMLTDQAEVVQSS